MYTQRSALRWKGILSILCLTATLSASAQRAYTLDECLRLGAENNLTLAAQLDELHRTVKASVDAGVTLPNALMKVELQQQNTASNRLKTANGLRINKLLFAQQTGIEEADFDVSFDAFPTFEAPETQFVEPTSGLSQRTDSRLLDIQVQHVQINRRMTLGNYLPTVALGGAYIYHDFMGKDARAAIVMATVSVPLSGWWGGSHALRRDKLKVQHAQNAREDARQLMRVDIETKWSNLSEAYLQIDLARRSVASATENLRLNRDSYEAGTVPLTDLLDAQTQLRLARDRYTEACTAYCNARTAYRQAVGEQGARIVPELSQFLCRRI